jgi:hypothetical protein
MKRTWFYVWLALYVVVISLALYMHWFIFNKNNAWIPLMPVIFSAFSFGLTYYLIDPLMSDIEIRLRFYGIIIPLKGNILYDARKILKNNRIANDSNLQSKLLSFAEIQKYSLFIFASVFVSVGMYMLLWFI